MARVLSSHPFCTPLHAPFGVIEGSTRSSRGYTQEKGRRHEIFFSSTCHCCLQCYLPWRKQFLSCVCENYSTSFTEKKMRKKKTE